MPLPDFKTFAAEARAQGFELDHAAEHAERYGRAGATCWAARRNAPRG